MPQRLISSIQEIQYSWGPCVVMEAQQRTITRSKFTRKAFCRADMCNYEETVTKVVPHNYT